MPVKLIDYAAMSGAERDTLAKMMSPLTSLEAVLNWAREQIPAHEIDDILTYDEYSHDVMIRWTENRFLVFDTM
jgi:hypothetical protein